MDSAFNIPPIRAQCSTHQPRTVLHRSSRATILSRQTLHSNNPRSSTCLGRRDFSFSAAERHRRMPQVLLACRQRGLDSALDGSDIDVREYRDRRCVWEITWSWHVFLAPDIHQSRLSCLLRLGQKSAHDVADRIPRLHPAIGRNWEQRIDLRERGPCCCYHSATRET